MITGQISCQRAKKMLPGYLDGSVTLGERELLERHWLGCAACSQERRDTELFDARTRAALRAVVANKSPGSRREVQIRRRLVYGPRSRSSTPWQDAGLGGVVAGLAAVLLVVSAVFGALRPAPAADLQPGFTSYAAPMHSSRDLELGNDEPVLRAPPVTIVFVDPTAERDAYKDLVAGFQQANKDVTVVVRASSPALSDPAALANQADCFVARASIAEGDTRAALHPLTRFAQADGHIRTEDFFPQLLGLVSHGSELYGLPRNARLHLAFFDRAALNHSGVVHPRRDWTTDDLAQSVWALQDSSPAKRYAFVPYNDTDALYLVVQRGANAPQPGGARLDASQVAEALTWYTEIAGPLVAPALGLQNPQDLALRRDLIAAREAAIWTGPPVPSARVRPNLGIVPLPADADTPTILDADAYFISGGTASAGACWRWIRYLSFQQLGGDVPARNSQVHSAGFVQQWGKRQVEAMSAALKRPNVLPPWPPAASVALIKAIDAVVLNGQSVAKALAASQRSLETNGW